MTIDKTLPLGHLPYWGRTQAFKLLVLKQADRRHSPCAPRTQKAPRYAARGLQLASTGLITGRWIRRWCCLQQA
jgi:hypothetical protein